MYLELVPEVSALGQVHKTAFTLLFFFEWRLSLGLNKDLYILYPHIYDPEVVRYEPFARDTRAKDETDDRRGRVHFAIVIGNLNMQERLRLLI